MFYLGLLLLGAGFCVILLELFVPSAGVLGFLAAALIIGGIVLGFMSSLTGGTILLVVALLVVPLLLALMVKVWPHTPMGKRILIGDVKAEDILPNSEFYQKTASLEGELGVARSKMLPSGQVVINGEKYDAISDGLPIEAGETVKVISVRENRLYVVPWDSDLEQEVPTDRGTDILSQPIEELGIDSLEDPLA